MRMRLLFHNKKAKKTMGQWLSTKQPKELRVIYIELKDKSILPIEWPDTLTDFKDEVRAIFGIEPTYFIFEDCCEKPLIVLCEANFRALVPKHRAITSEINLYYVGVNIPCDSVPKRKQLSNKMR